MLPRGAADLAKVLDAGLTLTVNLPNGLLCGSWCVNAVCDSTSPFRES